MYKNHEGYADPTAGEAVSNVAREEKQRIMSVGTKIRNAGNQGILVKRIISKRKEVSK